MRPNEHHGMSSSPEYGIWRTMISRCHDANTDSYSTYGARGITVCERWRLSFTAFYADMGPRPSPEYSLDRLENDQGYRPGNVKWRTQLEQQNNRRNNRRLIYEGQSHTLAELERLSGLGHKTISLRIEKGDSVEEALRPANARERRFEHEGKSLTINEWAALTGIDTGTLRGRLIQKKIPIEKALHPESLKLNLIEYQGRTLSVSAWARELGIEVATLRARLFKRGWSVERAFNEPTHIEKSNLPKTA
jgi:hypothetical protein